MKKVFVGFSLILLSVVLSAQSITINIVSPTGYQIVDSVLNIKASINSTYQLTTVTAQAGNRQTPLIFNQQTGYFQGTLSLSGLPQDTTKFLITASDVQGNQKNDSFKIIYDLKPVIIVASPLNNSTARPFTHAKAKCIDNGGHCSLQVSFSTYSGGSTTTIVGNYQDSADVIVDMSSSDGNEAGIAFIATDSRNQNTGETRNLYVESSPYLKEVFEDRQTDIYGSQIIDFNYNKVFIATSFPSPGKVSWANKIANIYTYDSTLLPLSGTGYVNAAYLHSNGAIFSATDSTQINYYTLRDWNGETLYNLGGLDPSSLGVSGDNAIYSFGTRLNWRNLLTKSNTIVSTNAINIHNDVASDGAIAYGDNLAYNINLYQNNRSTIISDNAGNTQNGYPVLGSKRNIIYNKHDKQNQNFYLYLFNGQTNILLSSLGSKNPVPGANYQANDKYAAYSKLGTSGQLQVWLRDTAGNDKQITFYGGDSWLDLLGSTGDLIFITYRTLELPRLLRRNLAFNGGQIKEVSSILGKTFYRDSTWYVALGRTLFKIDLNIPSDTVTNSSIEIKKDSVYKYTKSDFANNFEGPGQLMAITIVNVPKNGILRLNGLSFGANTQIQRVNFENLTYTPTNGFAGSDTIIWKGSNGIDYTSSTALIKINVQSAPVLPAIPTVTGIQNSYCASQGVQKGKINNLPSATSGITASVKFNGATLAIAADSTFSFDVSAVPAGAYNIMVSFTNSAGSDTALYNTSIKTASTPNVNLSSNITTVTNLTDAVTITATNAAGGGTSPRYTFAKDKAFSNILQTEGTSNTLTIQPNTLTVGSNWIYVSMKTSDTCYTAQTNIDSIKIERSTVTGLIDVDFPGQPINIYPNPFENGINISGLNTGKTYVISVSNAAGQKVYSQQFSNNQTISIHKAGLQSGRYWLSIYDVKKRRLIGTVAIMKQ